MIEINPITSPTMAPFAETLMQRLTADGVDIEDLSESFYLRITARRGNNRATIDVAKGPLRQAVEDFDYALVNATIDEIVHQLERELAI